MTKRRLPGLAAATVVAVLSLVTLEYGLRAIKSWYYDGAVYVATPSLGSRLHDSYGWTAPASFSFEKHDPCYGDGTVSYNAQGFRAAPLSEAAEADVVVCILGDSTMHARQIPDGGHLPHLLARKLGEKFENPYVLPLAVAGYGSLQEWMLFEDFCRPLEPDVVVWHWSSNDVVNNSYTADRFSGPNNIRPRPYLEDGRILMRRPYPVRIGDQVDSLVSMKLMNGILLDWSARPAEALTIDIEKGWRVAEQMVAQVAESAPERVALVSVNHGRAAEMFRAHGYRVAVHPPFPDDHKCPPRDAHPNSKGHKLMLAALFPVLSEALAPASTPAR